MDPAEATLTGQERGCPRRARAQLPPPANQAARSIGECESSRGATGGGFVAVPHTRTGYDTLTTLCDRYTNPGTGPNSPTCGRPGGSSDEGRSVKDFADVLERRRGGALDDRTHLDSRCVCNKP
jgi:hypothetical protein